MATLDASKRCEHGNVRGRCPYGNDGCATPARTGKRGPGQEVARRIEIARGLFLDHLGEHPTWDWGLEQMKATYPDLTQEQRRTALMEAELELEREHLVVYGLDGHFYWPGERDSDPAHSPSAEVAEAIKALPWGKSSRKVWKLFQELRAYRHCDVYDAIHEVLKPRGFVENRGIGNWFWMGPTITEHYDREEDNGALTPAERRSEQDLVDSYVAWLGRNTGPHRFSNLREADLYDEARSLLIEAKAHVDAVVAAHAAGQVMYYRSLGELAVQQVAILLPSYPADDVLRFLRIEGVGLIWEVSDGRFDEDLSLHRRPLEPA